MYRQSRSPRRGGITLLAACVLSLAVAQGPAVAQEIPLSSQASLVTPKWTVDPVSVRYDRSPIALMGSRVQVVLRLKNRTGMPMPLPGGAGLLFELEGNTIHRPATVNLSKTVAIPKDGEVTLTATFSMPAAQLGSVKYLHVGAADSNQYNKSGMKRIGGFPVPPAPPA